jgi:hypothetical protein
VRERMKKPLKEVSGTTLALTSLAVFAAAAVVSTPMWFYYRHKRKKIDSLANTPPEGSTKEEREPEPATAPPGQPPGSPDERSD